MYSPGGGAWRGIGRRGAVNSWEPVDRGRSARAGRGLFRAIVATARPRQWIKNVLVVAAPGAAGALGRDDVPGRVLVACLAFCLLASGIYAINDVRDAAEDRRHPVKRRRPVAAGELRPREAIAIGVLSIATGLAASVWISPLLGLAASGYVLLTLTYTLVWRHILFLDVIAIAGGFVLRAIAGGAAAPVELSTWFVLVVSFAAVLVAAGKRWAELSRTATAGGARRGVLEHYSESRLLAVLLLGAAGAMFTYGMWALELPTVQGIPWRPLTILPFVACLIRYGWLVRSGDGERPEDLVLGDGPLRFAAGSWLLLFALGVNAAT